MKLTYNYFKLSLIRIEVWNSPKKCNAYLHSIWDWLKPILQIQQEYKRDVISAADFEDSNWSWTRRKKKNTEKLRRFEKFREIFTGKQLESPRGPVWGYGTEFGA